MNVEWVKQEHERGCGIAALAMIAGMTYQQVADSGAPTGAIYRDMDHWLARHGYAVARRYAVDDGDTAGLPFSDLHLCNVLVSPEAPVNHWVVMLADGSVLDPLTPERKTLADYAQLHNVAAVTKILPPIGIDEIHESDLDKRLQKFPYPDAWTALHDCLAELRCVDSSMDERLETTAKAQRIIEHYVGSIHWPDMRCQGGCDKCSERLG